ncbi:Glycosyltransferase involved in cell wall bisynthesis [Bacteroides ovatus]|jgi:putative colanic acid biosynthesis glycosyltransferase|uniref:Glycosyltransferase involved in cell wall bisynthesis n=1 Tax=Bacteroides ovatus TaxID=28116 RepID=A0A1G6GBM4_BACOV|nr:glycosyltransferase [Bacteroides ovatus]SDB79397.1 Glycosyltransferase involved in cell wall bisynthesis [Bacteroides ovatus]
MPKLLQINSVVNTGSTGRIAEQLGQLAITQGWESYIAYGREARGSQSTLIKIGSKLDVYLHAIASKYLDCHGLMSCFATRKFLKQLDSIKPDVVHLHNIHGYYVNYPMIFRYLKEKNIPTVITMHDFWLMTGHCAYINKSCDRWKKGCGNCPRLDQYPAAMMDFSAKNWQKKANIFANMPNITLVPVSHWLGRYAEASLLKSVKQQVIYNGIDTEAFKPNDKSEASVSGADWTKFTIISIATRWTDANGYSDVMQLSRILPEDCQIVMVGLDDEQMKSLPKNVIGFKKTESSTQLRELYSKSDVIFNPNTEVTFGLVTVEAMACGTPAIVLRDTAGEELVDEQTGFVVDNVEQVLDLIPVLKKKDKVQMASASRQRVVEVFEAGKQYQKYFELYNNLIMR